MLSWSLIIRASCCRCSHCNRVALVKLSMSTSSQQIIPLGSSTIRISGPLYMSSLSANWFDRWPGLSLLAFSVKLLAALLGESGWCACVTPEHAPNTSQLVSQGSRRGDCMFHLQWRRLSTSSCAAESQHELLGAMQPLSRALIARRSPREGMNHWLQCWRVQG